MGKYKKFLCGGGERIEHNLLWTSGVGTGILQKEHFLGHPSWSRGSEIRGREHWWLNYFLPWEREGDTTVLLPSISLTVHFSPPSLQKTLGPNGGKEEQDEVPVLVAWLGPKTHVSFLISGLVFFSGNSHPLGSLRDAGICRGILEVWGQCPNFWLWNISRRPRISPAHRADL